MDIFVRSLINFSKNGINECSKLRDRNMYVIAANAPIFYDF